MGQPADLVLTAPIFDRSGFADEVRTAALALDRAGYAVHVNPMFWSGWTTPLSSGAAERLERLIPQQAPERYVHVMHGAPSTRLLQPAAVRNIARAMFETVGLPPGWVEACNAIDEVWVPTAFNVETFAAAGVERSRLHIVPEAIDLSLYDHGRPALRLPVFDGRFVFLSVFGWGRRKGWDALARAYLEEFRPDEPVLLALKISPSFGLTVADHQLELEEHIRGELGRDPAAGAPIAVLDLDPGEAGMPGLYRAADAFVLPSRGEGWGRTYMEAMAMGLPTIGTRWSGNLAFMDDDNSYLVDTELQPVSEVAAAEWQVFRGLHWGEPSVPQLRAALRRVYEERGEELARGLAGREAVAERCRPELVVQAIVERLEAAGVPLRLRATPSRKRPPLRVTWEGPQFTAFGMAIASRELCRGLIGSQQVELALRCPPPTEEQVLRDPTFAALAARVGARSSLPAEVHVRHEWPPRFDPPPAGRWVMMQAWEFGALPRAWIEPMNTLVDEVWVPSRWVKACYEASGVEPERVVVVPLGVDPVRFHQGFAPLPLPTRKRFRFLFCGGTIHRKGIDIAVTAYLRAFGPGDDVCLVVKDLGGSTFYRDQSYREWIRSLARDPSTPEILLLEDDLPGPYLPALYRSCHALVHPYRGEGFGLPIAEAMACGLAVIVPAYGPALDFCSPETAVLLPAREVRWDEARVGGIETVALPWWCEVEVDQVATAMRLLADDPTRAGALGARASDRVRRDLTWQRAADIAVGRLEQLAARPARRRPRRRQLSVCMIVKNEEAFLPACLESVREVADELVVVDTGSTDRTVEIAREHGAQVHHAEWADDFAAARNVSLAHARGDWALVFDADQTLDPGSHAELRDLLETEALRGYMLRQLNYTGAVGTDGVVEHLNLRLFPLHPAVRYRGRVHEQVTCSRPELGWEIVPTGVVVHHDGSRHGVYDTAKAARDRRVLEEVVLGEPTDAFHFYNLGVACRLLGDQEAAERHLVRCVALASPGPGGSYPYYLVAAAISLAGMALVTGRLAEAAGWSDRALALQPDSAEAHCLRATALGQAGLLDQALAGYAAALRCGGALAHAPTDLGAAGWRAWLGMADVHAAAGRLDEAGTCIERAAALVADVPEIGVARGHLAALRQRSSTR